MNCWRSEKRPSSWKICCAPRCRLALPWPPNTNASSSVSCSCAATGLCCTSASVAGSLGGAVPWAFLAHRHNLRPPARRLAHRGKPFPSLPLPQTRFLRPVPSRAGLHFSQFFASCGLERSFFGATSIGRLQLSRPRNGRSRKPLFLPGAIHHSPGLKSHAMPAPAIPPQESP